MSTRGLRAESLCLVSGTQRRFLADFLEDVQPREKWNPKVTDSTSMFAELVPRWPLEFNIFPPLSSVLWHAKYYNEIQGEQFEAILPLLKDQLWPLGTLITPLWLPPGHV